MGLFDALKGVFGGKPPKESQIQKLEAQREKLLAEIKVAERKFLQHQIDEKTYRGLSEENQMKLIALEAEIETKKIEQKIDRLQLPKLEKLSTKRKEQLAQLLAKKDLLLRELELARQKYLKRQIGDETYKKLTADWQKQLIMLEVDIASIYREEAREIIKEAQEKLAKAEKEERVHTEEEMAEALLSETEFVERQRERPRVAKAEEEEMAEAIYKEETGQLGPEEKLERIRVREVKELEPQQEEKLPRRLRRKMRQR